MKITVLKKRTLPCWLSRRFLRWALPLLGLLVLLAALQCPRRGAPPGKPGAQDYRKPPPPGWGGEKRSVPMTVTAYSSDGKSTGWEYNDSGVPVYTGGPNKGEPKRVGITADGSVAIRGTIAADTRYYPFGTRMFVPGYGWGAVHDRGGAIKTPFRIDVFFPTRQQALEWGRQKLEVTVVLPETP